jgi:hypothetical protein
MARVQSSSGQQAMVAITTITVIAMVTSPAYTPSLLVRSMIRASHHGTQNPVHQPSRSRTAVAGRERM